MAYFKRPPSDTSSADGNEQLGRASKRRATVYDAVAGRVSQWGFIPPQPNNLKTNATQPLRPDEILFKARNAPTRYEETDYYFAHTQLPQNQKLPSGDLLSALHAYISKFYARSEENGSQKVWKSMDETALIALGILMEETAGEILGETGDLAFLEGGEDDGSREVSSSRLEEKGNVSRDESGKGDESIASLSDDGSRYATEETE